MYGTAPLWKFAEVSPPTPELNGLTEADEVTFIPLENVWPTNKADDFQIVPWEKRLTGYTPFRRGDLLLPKVTPTVTHGRTMFTDTATELGVASTEVYTVRARPGTDPRWLAYLLVGTEFLGLAGASVQGTGGLKRISTQFVESYLLPDASSEEQRAIADYLDRETAEIDAMTTDLDKMEALLTERRATTVRSTMDRAAEFGRIPLGYVAQTVSGATPSTSIAKYWADSAESGIHWVSIGDMSSVPVVLETQKYVSTEGRKTARLKVAGPGTVLFAMYGATLGAVSRLGVDACWNQAILGVFPHESRLSPEFLESALIALKPSLEALHRGNTQNNLNAEQVKGLPIPLPPLEVQEAISQELSEKTAEIDAMLADITELRDLLAERRAAVIAAAVTGQIDIPAAEETTHD
ncbi:DNA restriction-modification system, specificity subunit [Corynebacterium jeikeium]|uniref:Putative DNA restriction-modification system, specificity subunit n=1 Tax=Corynebacterium jeikeium (strain K411) TaxID=306537 RepID=Q4JVU5_CORJK|nr:restriction endonuclease subunit S [Corynebacterium jeikeium]CAI37062.1 putative DNA restriction-modification system, specificity subunit [Corynebacterium jeikeium K411]SUY85574.1 DNA restriction-modification system, specificity subunit [Corynebacterium jeikeium]